MFCFLHAEERGKGAMEKNYRVTMFLCTYKVQGKAITQKDPEMSRVKAQQILDTPDTVQLYVSLRSELCLTQLAKEN